MEFGALVEGVIDEAVARRLLSYHGHTLGVCYGKKGCGYISRRIRGFNASAAGQPILALVDLMDTGMRCAPAVVAGWVPQRRANFLLRVVEREIESWLLADIAGISDFLGVSPMRFPQDPDNLADAKRSLVNLARQSRKPRIRKGLVPEPRSSAQVGKRYVSEIVGFAAADWDVERAGRCSPSLERCLRRLEEFD